MSRSKPRPFTTSKVKEAVRLHKEGKTQAETGKILGRHPGVIHHAWKANGLTRGFVFDNKLNEKIIKARKRGRTYTSISIEIGVPETTLKRHCKNLGITRKNKIGEKK